MKKLLLIGAMLIVGASSFGDVLIKLNETNKPAGQKKVYSGEGNLPIISRGNIIKTTGRVTLIVEAVTTTGADNTNLEFQFGKLLKGESKVQLGEFKARVLKDNTEIPILTSTNTSAISSEILDNGTAMSAPVTLKNITREDIGTIFYELNPSSGLTNENKSYIGKVSAQLALKPNSAVGSFEHTSSSIKVKITDLDIK